MRALILIVGLILGIGCTPAGVAAPGEGNLAEDGKVTVPLAKKLGPQESLAVRVTVGALPKGSRVVVKSEGGEVLGSITPFGRATNQPGVFYTLPVPQEAISGDKLSLIFKVEEAGGTNERVPTGEEIKKVEPQLLQGR